MSGCRNNKIKCNCGTRQNARCVYYDGYLPKYSKLDEDCVNIEETTEELYKNQEFILKSIDASKLKEDCVDHHSTEIDGEGKILVVDILQALQNEICVLKKNTNGSDCGCIDITKLDLKCLEDGYCANPYSITGVMQLMIDKICEIDNRLSRIE